MDNGGTEVDMHGYSRCGCRGLQQPADWDIESERAG